MPEQTSSSLITLLPMVVMLGAFYLFIIRPQKKKEKEVREMRDALKVGDNIITVGGILGKIAKVKDDIVVIEVGSQKMPMEILKSAIISISKKKDAKETVLSDNI